ncbi:hypothetical protein B566_EDAN010215 [Ephemera danica]|nr:hypothetical protein B566_EDAN010215 [Ephemera danica]
MLHGDLESVRRGEMCTASAAGTAPHPATARGLLSGSSAGVPTQVNVTLVGALGSGKSALTVKYMTGRFIGDYDPDMEDTYCKRETLDGMEMEVLVMDTCDREGRDPERYLHWADAFLIVYSVTSAASFATAQRYLEALSGGSQGPTFQLPLLLVGNKADLETHRGTTSHAGNRQ